MKRKTILLFLISGAVVLFQLSFAEHQATAAGKTISYFREEAILFAADAANLHEAIKKLDPTNDKMVQKTKLSLAHCRNQYKKISFFIEYFFPSESHVYNAAAVTEVEDAELEFIEPMGLQQIENLLYQPDIAAVMPQLLMQSESLYTSASDINSLLYRFSASDAQVLESVRIELTRIMTLYITGYDAPELKTGITESYTAIKAIHHVLNFYSIQDHSTGKTIDSLLTGTEKYLDTHDDFDTFQRMEFLTQFALPLQVKLGHFIRSFKLELNTKPSINYDVPDMFSPGFINKASFGKTGGNKKKLIELGRKLFTENTLSVNHTRSCATCHNPDKYFTDELPKSLSLIGHKTVTRNAPTLLYAAMQQAQFWDGRTDSLPALIRSVILNTEEMNGSEEKIMPALMRNASYRSAFMLAFPGDKKESLGLNHVATAIAAYIQTLTPMNSPFDRYIQGDQQAMNLEQVKGFDLFMGKAKCGSCHFAPFFNSLLPPYYNVSEYEIIGTTHNDDLAHAVKDTDRGRFTTYPVKYYDGAFKTPTVRNTAKTAPYMHNGAFKTLDSLVAFYNKGGGEGIGIKNEMQTLSPHPLQLTAIEIKQLIAFINALTDEPQQNILNKQLKQYQ